MEENSERNGTGTAEEREVEALTLVEIEGAAEK
jgi:hypothetical protein